MQCACGAPDTWPAGDARALPGFALISQVQITMNEDI